MRASGAGPINLGNHIEVIYSLLKRAFDVPETEEGHSCRELPLPLSQTAYMSFGFLPEIT